jgi:tRNA (guanine37-N1)-methyltransferase
MWIANVFTLFPEAFPGNLGVSLIGKSLAESKWHLNIIDLKKFPAKSDRVDFVPYGGGAGMILSPITFEKAFSTLSDDSKKMRRIYFSPRGRRMNQNDLRKISNEHGITMLCGRYEGVDQRILDLYEMEEISMGDFVLLGGEVAAMAIIEGCIRLIPGVVGDIESINNESFQENLLEHNQYTRPSIFRGSAVPDVLMSGDHERIKEFRDSESKTITMKKRPDLWARYVFQKLSQNDG